MTEPHVITALVEKYRQLSGRMLVCDKEAAAIRADLAHLDAAIRLFKADYDTAGIPPKRPYRTNRLFRVGSLSRNALGILRAADEPVTAREIVLMALREQGVSDVDAATLQALRNTLNGCLARREKAGLVVASEVEREKRWAIPVGL